MNRQHDLPEIDYDDPAGINPRGRRRRVEIERDDDEQPTAMPSWSWMDIAILCGIGLAGYYLIFKGIMAVIKILTAEH